MIKVHCCEISDKLTTRFIFYRHSILQLSTVVFTATVDLFILISRRVATFPSSQSGTGSPFLFPPLSPSSPFPPALTPFPLSLTFFLFLFPSPLPSFPFHLLPFLGSFPTMARVLGSASAPQWVWAFYLCKDIILLQKVW